jgi:uncharacterized protein (TIGR03437 family)
MMTSGFRRFALFALAASVLCAQPRRVTTAIDNARRVALSGRVDRNATPANDAGQVAPSFELTDVRLNLRPASQPALDQLLQDQQDPSSPNFHKWLTPEQYGDRFGASPDDVKAITTWLESQGFTNIDVAHSRTWVTFSGTAAQIAKAFQTEIHRYNVRGEQHFANATDPTIPAAIASVVSGVAGLTDFRLQPRLRKVTPLLNNGSRHNLAPDDVATIYNIAPLYADGVDGAGQKMVVVGQTAIRTADIANFRSRFNLPTINLTQVQATRRAPGILAGDVDEAHLDIEWSSAVARNANIIYVYGTDVWTSAMYAVDRNLAPVISMSYGLCEAMDLVNLPDYQRAAQQANAQGITWFAASGDSGAGDCEDRGATVAQNGFQVDVPSALPEITAMGGTQFDDASGSYWSAAGSALSYIPERAWNDGPGVEIGGGGGGVSTVFARPAWQTGAGFPSAGGRLVPDLSFSSSAQHVGYFVYSGGVAYFGGTSVAAPLMAGVATLLNHYVTSTGAAQQSGLGNINTTLYRLAQSAPDVFHDVVAGDNGVSCAAGSPDCDNGYFGRYAGPGYDMATGLGSINAYNLAHRWTSFPAITSAVVPSVDRNPVFQQAGAWTFTVTLTESAGIATRLTDFTVDGVSQTIAIKDIPARGSVSASVTLTGIAAPKTVVLSFKGVDAGGAAWSTDFSVPFKGPQVALTVAGVSNAASGEQVFAPGMILSVYGTGLGNFAQAAGAIPLPNYLSGFSAWINGVESPLYYVSPNQVNIQIPYETVAGPATLDLGNPFENKQYSFTVSNAGPGIFTLANGRVNPSSSAARGAAATMFITGDGQVTPTLATGTTPSSRTAIANLPKPRQSVTVTVGGQPATIDFIGIPSGLVGVTQINFRIPAGVATGEQPVVVTVGTSSSNTAKIVVQ